MTAIDPQTMKRLAFIRLLYQQGLEQAHLPEPLSYASLLTFHDAVELFLHLAAQHLGATLPRRDPNFLDYWQILRRTDTFPGGADMSGQPAMDRLNRHRNGLKHAGAFPGRDAVDEALVTVPAFFEDNAPRVFAIQFSAIDMADVVPQDAVRAGLKASAAAEAAEDRTEAMAQLAEAFRDLFAPYASARTGAYGFGPTVNQPGGFAIGVESALHELARSVPNDRGIVATGRRVDGSLAQLTKAVAEMQRGMRVLALGIDYGRYDRFQRLTPDVYLAGEHRQVRVDNDYAPTRAEYDDCVQFVITASLRLAEVEANAADPSWHPRWP